MAKKPTKSREQVCGILYRQGLASEEIRIRKGEEFKAQALTPQQAAWLMKAKPENKQAFKPGKNGREWEGMFICEEKIVWARITITKDGGQMRVTEHAAPDFKRCARLTKALRGETFHEMLFVIALGTLPADQINAFEKVVKEVRRLGRGHSQPLPLILKAPQKGPQALSTT